jgi:hypothetical protein
MCVVDLFTALTSAASTLSDLPVLIALGMILRLLSGAAYLLFC